MSWSVSIDVLELFLIRPDVWERMERVLELVQEWSLTLTTGDPRILDCSGGHGSDDGLQDSLDLLPQIINPAVILSMT